jgi:hypothetical protein
MSPLFRPAMQTEGERDCPVFQRQIATEMVIGRSCLKIFFILAEAEAKKRNVVPLISAFAGMESIGRADDILHAIEIIRCRYPGAAIFSQRMLRQNPELALKLSTCTEGPLVVLPENYGIKQKSIYIGVDLSPDDAVNFGWTIRSIQKLTAECRGKAAEKRQHKMEEGAELGRSYNASGD